jgi:hypothetical protein
MGWLSDSERAKCNHESQHNVFHSNDSRIRHATDAGYDTCATYFSASSIFVKDFIADGRLHRPTSASRQLGILDFFLGIQNYVVDIEFARAKSGTPNRYSLRRSWCPAQVGFHPLCRLILPHLEDAPNGLDTVPGTPSGDERARQGGIREIDREGVIQHPACPRGGHRPSVRAAILVEPNFDPVESGAQAVCRDADPDTRGETSF